MNLNPYEETERFATSAAGGREVEAWALLELAKRLERARKENPEDLMALLEVVRLNWRAWTVIQSSLLSEDSEIEQGLRENLLTLCAFIDKQSNEFLSDPVSDKLQILIDINVHLSQGLRGNRISDKDLEKTMENKKRQIEAKENEAKEKNAINEKNEAKEKNAINEKNEAKGNEAKGNEAKGNEAKGNEAKEKNAINEKNEAKGNEAKGNEAAKSKTGTRITQKRKNPL